MDMIFLDVDMTCWYREKREKERGKKAPDQTGWDGMGWDEIR